MGTRAPSQLLQRRSYTISSSVTIGSESMAAVTVGTTGTGSTGVDGFGWIAFDTVANVT